jgi:hypothetical protein
MKRFGLALGLTALAVVLATGCRRHHRRHGHGGDDKGAPEAFWPASQMSANEGSSFSVTLTLDQVWDAPVDIALSSSDSSRLALPASVTFPTGVTTRTITVTTFVDADTSDTLVLVHATSLLDDNTMGILLRETAVTIGNALGPVTVGPNRAVLVTDGPDGFWGTGDDTLAVASGIGSGIPAITHVTIGAVSPGPHALPLLTGISDTVLVQTNGPDQTLGTTDDTLVEVGGVSGATPSVTSSIVVGRMEASEGRRPVMVGTTAIFLTRGSDLVTNADDEMAMVGGIGTGTLTLSTFPTPGVGFEAPSLVVPMDASTVLLHLTGADMVFATIDDQIIAINGLPAAPAIAFPGSGALFDGRMGVPIAVNATTIGALQLGGDLTPGTADDVLIVVRDAFTVPAGSFAVLGPVMNDANSQWLLTPGDTIVVPMLGADLTGFTSDDEVSFLVGASAGPLGAPVYLPSPTPVAGPHGRLQALDGSTAIRLSSGFDGILGTPDDNLRVLSDLTGAGSTSGLVTGALQAMPPVIVSTSRVALAGEGADAVPGTTDDEVLDLSGIGGVTTLDSTFPGRFRLSGPAALVPGGGSFVFLARTAGGDDAPGTADDVLSSGSVP